MWTVADVPGLGHEHTAAPVVPHPDELKTLAELLPDAPPPFPFWANFDRKPVEFHPVWPPPGPLEPTWRHWLRFTPDAGWLLVDGHAPVAADGLVGWTGRLWTVEGTLVASGGGQLLCRRISGTTPAGSPGPTAPPDSTG